MAYPDMIGFVVKDMAATLAFYRLIGLDIPTGVEHEDHVEIISPNGYRLAWDTIALVKSFSSHWVEPVGHRMGMAFKCASADEVDVLYASVVAAGYESVNEPWNAFWGQRYARVGDPDGNVVDLFAPL